MGRIAVSAKLITQEQLMEALRAQDHMGATKRLGDILLELGYISQAQLDWLLRAQATLVERQRQAGAEAQRRRNSRPAEIVPAKWCRAARRSPSKPAPAATPRARPCRHRLFRHRQPVSASSTAC
jgi:hypothetical protein